MITLSEQLQIPFYNSEGEHLITLPIEPHDDRRPPGMAELVGPDATGAVMRHYYELRPDARGGSGVALRRGPPGTAGASAAGRSALRRRSAARVGWRRIPASTRRTASCVVLPCWLIGSRPSSEVTTDHRHPIGPWSTSTVQRFRSVVNGRRD
jgi:hypothetical protein